MDQTSSHYRLLVDAFIKACKKLFTDGQKPSVEDLFQVIIEFSLDVFHIYKEEMIAHCKNIIETFPNETNAAMEFVLKYLLPALLASVPGGEACLILTKFLKESFSEIIGSGTVRGSHFIKPVGDCILSEVAKRSAIMLSGKLVDSATKTAAKQVSESVTKAMANQSMQQVSENGAKEVAKEVAKSSATKSSVKLADSATKTAAKQASESATTTMANQSTQQVSKHCAQVVKDGAMKSGSLVADDATKAVAAQVSKETTEALTGKAVKEGLSETAESVATSTSGKVSEELTKAGTKQLTKAGIKSAAIAGAKQAGIAAVISGVFLTRDMIKIKKDKEEGLLNQEDYKCKRNGLVGEFVGDVVSSGLVGAGLCLAGLTGPAAVVAIGGGAVLSFGAGQLGGFIGRRI